ncbi:MAG: pyrimidine 5'-nucleotidase [Thermaurantiacus tibetensis]|uniref:pyrimidine 5'-nucleotidase n=1 Tax=Thermaurantiacus tibetensis TaxID=2759035 RepID=UPI00188DFFAC|nr:pyrimidine 5'-nucleotidase [Thermaurantiacus tibetensis]
MHGPAPGLRTDPRAALAHVESWLFDMDNTLYPASVNLFAQIDRKMEAYVGRLLGLDREGARAVQKRYFHEHGTTLRGLMLSHGVDPHDFLAYVHDIDVSVLAPDPALAASLKALPGRRFVFTNGDLPYAERVLSALGILDCFEAIHDIHAMAYHPKPDARAYDGLVARFGLVPERCFFAEDMAHNLMPAKARGMTTLWVNNGSERGAHGHSPAFVDFETHDLAHFLAELAA